MLLFYSYHSNSILIIILFLGHVQISTGNDNIPIGIGVTHKHKKKMKALKKTTAQTAAPPNQVISYVRVNYKHCHISHNKFVAIFAIDQQTFRFLFPLGGRKD